MLRATRKLIEFVLGLFCAAILATLAALILVAVTTRKLGVPFGWYDEVASVLLAWLTWYGAALAALRRAHLGFPNLIARLPFAAGAALLLLRTAVICTFFAVVGRYGLEVVLLLRGDTLVSLPWVPVSLTQSVIPAGAFLFVVAELVVLPERLADLRARRPAFAPEQVEGTA